MGLTMRERHAIVQELAPRFRQATKKHRGQILKGFVELTGYTRCYAAFVFRTCGSKHVRMIGTRRVTFVPGHARKQGTPRVRHGGYSTATFLNIHSGVRGEAPGRNNPYPLLRSRACRTEPGSGLNRIRHVGCD